MSTEIPPTESTEPVVSAPKSSPVKPDNWYNDSATETPAEGLLTGEPASDTQGENGPDNWYNDSAPTG
jgi:hypothetical protein